MNFRNPKSEIRLGRDRGSVLILVVAVLVLLVLVGTAYIQAARNDRVATAEMNKSNIDAVTNASLDQVIGVIAKDMYGTDTMLLDSDVPNPDATAEENDEPYDYPHDEVDPWLAWTLPDFSGGGNGVWKHISNVNRNLSGNDYVSSDQSDDVAVIDATADTFGQDLDNDDRADADGDGIADSRWTNAPIAWVNGLRYVVAYRILDLSSMVNANVALAQTDANLAYGASIGETHAPRWAYASELDLAHFVGNALTNLGVPAAGGPSELKELLNYRVNGNESAEITLPLTWTTRRDFHENGLTQGFPSAANYKTIALAENELELRARGGLNTPETTSQIGELLQVILREDQSREKDYSDVNSSIPTFLKHNPRGLLTVMSGAMPYAPRLATDTDIAPPRKVGINTLLTDDAGRTTLATEIKKVLDEGNDGGAITPPSGIADTQTYANQIVAAMADYADDDNKLTAVGTGAAQQFGMEPLPAIGEIYRQRQYEAEWEEDNGLWDLKWKFVSPTVYAIEIRNPHPFPIENLDKVWLTGDGGTNRITVSSFIGDQTTMDAKEVIVVYRNNAVTDEEEAEAQLSNRVEADVTTHLHTTPPLSVLWNDAAFTLELEVETTASAPDDKIAVQKVHARAFDDSDLDNQLIENDQDETFKDNNPPSDYGFGYKQLSNIGNGNGINALLVTEVQTQGSGGSNPDPASDPPASAKDGEYKTDLERLGKNDKTDADGAPANTIDEITGTGTADNERGNQLLFASDPDDKFRRVGDLAQVFLLGPTASQTLADRFEPTEETVDAYMLDPITGAMVSSSQDHLKVPWPVVLLDRLATERLDEDSADNDGDGDTNEPDEALQFGRINLNTAPEEVLQRVLPIADSTYRNTIARLIVAYRNQEDNTANPGGGDFTDRAALLASGWRARPGIANLGEVYAFTYPVLGNDALDNKTLPDASGVVIDFSPGGTDKDGIVSDREEMTFPLKWLTETATTRSDRFVVYMKVRGYDVTQATGAGEEWSRDVIAEEKRIVAIIDRSNMQTADDRPRVIAWSSD